MKFSRKTLIRLMILTGVFAMLGLALAPATAQGLPPSIKVTPTWRPGQVLTSENSNGGAFPSYLNDGNWDPGVTDDDVRYIDVDIMVTTTVQFWTAQLTCTIPPTLLEGYPFDDPGGGSYPLTDDPGDDTPMVMWGSRWEGWGNDYTTIGPGPVNAVGSMTFTATRMGYAAPLGRMGAEDIFLLATVRYRVKTQAALFTSGLASFTCTASFLNRDGKPAVIAPLYTAPPMLSIISGWTIEGQVMYQTRLSHAGIGVICDPNGGDPPAPSAAHQVRTDLYGKFKITTRLQTGYDCVFFGNATTAEPLTVPPAQQPDLFLSKSTWIDLWESRGSYTELPVILLLGNIERAASPNEISAAEDLALVTGNFGLNAGGDVTGDLLTDKADLAIVSANLYRTDGLTAEHLIVGAQTRPSTIYPDSRIWLNHQGDSWYMLPTQLIAGTNRDFWPDVSPNGKLLAFTRAVGTGAATRYAIFVQNADGTGIATRLTPATGWDYDAFAPSWSPDGSKIAFNCSYVAPAYNYRSWQWYDSQSNLCLMDANGRNLQQIASGVKIYPAAWQWDNGLIVAGTPGNFACPETLCGVDATNGYSWTLDSDVPNGADMPAVQYGRLIYRYDDGFDRVLRIATLDADGDQDLIGPYTTRAAALPGGCCSTEYHTDVTWDNTGVFEPISTNVAYHIYYSDHIMYYTGDNQSSGYDFAVSFFTGDYWSGNPPTWWSPEPRWIDGIYGNPWWSGNTNNSTDLFALRNSMIWTR